MSADTRPEVVVVTGASAGVGRATAQAFAKHGAHVGLLAEMADAKTGEFLGNIPQAFSHVGLVKVAWSLAEPRTNGSGESYGEPRAAVTGG